MENSSIYVEIYNSQLVEDAQLEKEAEPVVDQEVV